MLQLQYWKIPMHMKTSVVPHCNSSLPCMRQRQAGIQCDFSHLLSVLSSTPSSKCTHIHNWYFHMRAHSLSLMAPGGLCVDRFMMREGPPILPPGQIMAPVCTSTVCGRNAWMSRGGGGWGPPRRSAPSSARLWCASPLTLLQGEQIFKFSTNKFKLLLNWPKSVLSKWKLLLLVTLWSC